MSALCGAPATHVDHIVPLARWGGWRNGSTSAWRRLRAWVLMRDGYRCQLPVDADGQYDAAGEPPAPLVSGPHDPCNLRAACQLHNQQRGDGTGIDHRRQPAAATRWEW